MHLVRARNEARGALMLETNLVVGTSEPLVQPTSQPVFAQRLGAGHGAGGPPGGGDPTDSWRTLEERPSHLIQPLGQNTASFPERACRPGLDCAGSRREKMPPILLRAPAGRLTLAAVPA